jgi:hypothetical protein
MHAQTYCTVYIIVIGQGSLPSEKALFPYVITQGKRNVCLKKSPRSHTGTCLTGCQLFKLFVTTKKYKEFEIY